MATRKAARPSRSKDTLQAELERVRTALLSREEVDPITASEEAKRKAGLAEQLGVVTAKSVTDKLGALSLDAQATLDALKTTLISSTAELEELRELIAVESERLEEIYGKDVVSAALVDLLSEYENKKRDQAHGFLTKQQELDAKIRDQMAAEVTRKAAAEQERKREEEQYTYGLNKKRTEELDKIEQEKLAIKRTFDENNRQLERGWKDREEKLTFREEELTKLQERVDAFEEESAGAVKKAVESATGAMSREHKHAMALAESQAKAAEALLQNENKNLAAQLAAANAAMTSLNQKLAASEARVESIAKSAMERDGGQAALAAASKMAETLQPTPTKR